MTLPLRSRIPQLTLAQLELFVGLAEAGGFTAAAVRRGITQSAVSHAFRALEQALGTPLFDRRVSPPVLTESAKRLLPHARTLLGAADAMRQEVQAERGLKWGVLRIGSFGPSSSLRLLPRLLRAFALRHPQVEVRVEEESDQVVAQWISERRVELGFVTLPEQRFDTVHVASDEYVVLLPELHPLASHARVRAKQLHEQPFITSSAGCGDDIAGILAAAGAQPRELFRLPQVLSVLGLVQQASSRPTRRRLSSTRRSTSGRRRFWRRSCTEAGAACEDPHPNALPQAGEGVMRALSRSGRGGHAGAPGPSPPARGRGLG
jgi:DNA-binding transcriptional LysR family regulator